MKIVNNKLKLAMIDAIDKLAEASATDRIVQNKLKKMREKYIYKDIGRFELLEDLKWLKDLKSLVESGYYKNNYVR